MLSGRAQELSRNLYSPAMRYFMAAAEAGSIRAASRELNVASSAVNRQILWLEDALGMQLFDRVGRRIRLSQAGELLLAHIRRTYSDFGGTVAELDALKGLRRGSVSIASVESVSEKLLPALISSFRKRYPGIHVSVSISSSQDAAAKVEAAEADVGFTFDPPENSALTVAFEHELVIGALMSPRHPLADQQVLGLHDCLKFPVALPAEGLSLRTRLDLVRSRIPGASRTYVEANSLRLMRALEREEDVIGFQTMIGCEDDLASGSLVFRPLNDAPLQADRLCVITSSLRALALAPGMFFDHAVLTMKDNLPSIDAKTAS
ncbi:MAG: LysR family transcriptional regulator [Roseibium sp.]|uniref:LysR family transcriptional regulator n=1 Tax=Roseibium sp. TaxID=1936156 RepID=UPI003D9C28B1